MPPYACTAAERYPRRACLQLRPPYPISLLRSNTLYHIRAASPDWARSRGRVRLLCERAKFLRFSVVHTPRSLLRFHGLPNLAPVSYGTTRCWITVLPERVIQALHVGRRRASPAPCLAYRQPHGSYSPGSDISYRFILLHAVADILSAIPTGTGRDISHGRTFRLPPPAFRPPDPSLGGALRCKRAYLLLPNAFRLRTTPAFTAHAPTLVTVVRAGAHMTLGG